MADERQREISRPSLADAIDLLDLVRSSEDGARISMESPSPMAAPPTSATDAPAAAPAEEFVDVGDEAVDVAPSLPPARVDRTSIPPAEPPPKRSTPPQAKAVPVSRPSAPSEAAPSGMPPAAGILLVLGLAIGGLYAILAIPSSPSGAPSGTETPPALGAEPANLQLERAPE